MKQSKSMKQKKIKEGNSFIPPLMSNVMSSVVLQELSKYKMMTDGVVRVTLAQVWVFFLLEQQCLEEVSIHEASAS